MIVLNIIPAGPDLTYETYDFFLETAEPNEAEQEAIRYLDEVLQVEDINLVESVQRGMATPAFSPGPDRERPLRVGPLGTRRPSLPRSCTRRLPRRLHNGDGGHR